MAVSHEAYVKRLKLCMKEGGLVDFYRLYEKNYKKLCSDLLGSREKDKSVKLLRVNSQLRFNQLLEKNELAELSPVLSLILEDEVLFTQFVNQIHEKDNFIKVVDNLAAIHKLDPLEFKEYFKLSLAIAVVWDVERPRIHGQIGRNILEHKNLATDVYSYFKKLYGKRKSAIRFKELSVKDLVFVVNTPVPISELEWALKEVKGKAKRWGSHYSGITYDTPRLAANQMTWPQYNGAYSMENIEEYGGICVDQAYFTIMSARAHGIPAMYFTGQGRDGGHAWAGIFLDENDWDTEIGKYEQSNYAVGYAQDPQTDQAISNHELELSCNRKFYRSTYLDAKPYVQAIENLMLLKETALAAKYAILVKAKAPLYTKPWEVLELFYKERKKLEQVHDLFKAKLRLFKSYPDIYASTEQSYAIWLLEQKELVAAEKILKKSFKKGKDERIDLMWVNARAYYKLYEEVKDLKEASKVLERFIYENYKEMSNIFPALNEYYDFVKRNKLAEDGCSFVERVYKKMIRLASDLNREPLMDLMIKFYQLAKDKRGEAKVKKELDKYREKKAKEVERSKRKDKRRQQEDSYYYE